MARNGVESPWVAVVCGFFLQLIGAVFAAVEATGPDTSGRDLMIFIAGVIVVAGSVCVLVGCIAAGVEWGNRRTGK